MADLRTTQEYLNAKAGTVGLTKQQCLQRLAGGIATLSSNPMTAQDAANKYAGSTGRSTAGALCKKAGICGKDGQDASRRI